MYVKVEQCHFIGRVDEKFEFISHILCPHFHDSKV
jgi:hypothetical protein